MKQRPRRYITDSEMSLIWDRWEKSESLNAIARNLGRYHSAVQGALARSGGIRPAPRRRSRLALSLAEREEISRGIVAGHSIRSGSGGMDCFNWNVLFCQDSAVLCFSVINNARNVNRRRIKKVDRKIS